MPVTRLQFTVIFLRSRLCISNPGPTPTKVWIWGLSQRAGPSEKMVGSFNCCNCGVLLEVLVLPQVQLLLWLGQTNLSQWTFGSFNKSGIVCSINIVGTYDNCLWCSSFKHHQDMCTSLLFLSCSNWRQKDVAELINGVNRLWPAELWLKLLFQPLLSKRSMTRSLKW